MNKTSCNHKWHTYEEIFYPEGFFFRYLLCVNCEQHNVVQGYRRLSVMKVVFEEVFRVGISPLLVLLIGLYAASGHGKH